MNNFCKLNKERLYVYVRKSMKNGKSKWPSVKAWHNKVVKDVGNFKRKSVKINILSGDVNV